MSDNKLKVILTRNYNKSLRSAGIIRIKHQNGQNEDVIIFSEPDYHLILSILNKVEKLDSRIKHRSLVPFGQCFIPNDEIPSSDVHMYGSFSWFLSEHPYISKLYDDFWDMYPEKEGDYDELGRMKRKRRLIPTMVCVTPKKDEDTFESDRGCRPD